MARLSDCQHGGNHENSFEGSDIRSRNDCFGFGGVGTGQRIRYSGLCGLDCGPTPVTYDFETPGTTPIFLGGAIVGPGTTDGQYAQPLGSTGLYFSAGPSTGGPPTNITIGNNISSFSLIWGSLDDYNTLILHTMVGDYTYTGLDIAALIPGLANGDQSAPNTNPIVTFMLSGLDQQAVSFNMLSTQNAFEIDNIAVN